MNSKQSFKNKKQEVNTKEEDIINHPKHYNRKDAMECIDEMVEVFGIEAVKNYCLCNVWKYRYRASDKNGQEDLLKSDWYMRKYKELNKTMTFTTISSNDPIIINNNDRTPVNLPYISTGEPNNRTPVNLPYVST